MKVNANPKVTIFTVFTGVCFLALAGMSFYSSQLPAEIKPTTFAVRCVKIEDEKQFTVFERSGVSNVKTSNKDGNIVLIVYNPDGTDDMFKVEKNHLCSIVKE